MNYAKIYGKLVSYAKSQNRVKKPMDGLDRHHIFPKSLGGTNDPNNIVFFTGREHYLAHKLLVRMYSGDKKKKMIYALWWMSKTKRSGAFSNTAKITSRDYEYARKLFVEANVNNDPKRKERVRKNRLAGIYKYDSVSMGQTLSKTLNKMSIEEKRQRMLNSTMKADHEERGKAIRRGKASTIEVINYDNSKQTLFSDQVESVLGLTWPQVKYRVNAHNGLLIDGRKITMLKKYTGGNKWKNK
jgi:hypothetical protein